MKIKQVELNNFKRFTNLTIKNIPETAELVLLIGANGSGKSCIFDAFEALSSYDQKPEADKSYYTKDRLQAFKITLTDTEENIISNENSYHYTKLPVNSFYGRTGLRQVPRLTRKTLGKEQFDLNTDSDRPRYYIERDERFENDIEHITGIILKEFFRAKILQKQIHEKYIDPINVSLERIFGTQNGTQLKLLEIIPPLEGNIAQINFKKGKSEIHYNYLSAGEKEVFNILINLLSRKELYQNTVYFIDELDIHLNTRLQFNFIKEITEHWIPQNCQLWTASHSLGFIEYAANSEKACIIDLDNLDFDLPQTIVPVIKENPEIYEIAVGKDFLPSLFRHMHIFFVENKDRDLYALLGISNTIFLSDNNRNTVFYKVKSTHYHGIVDRDFLSDDDLIHIQQHYPNLHILEYYSIENYLYHPDNLENYYVQKGLLFDKAGYLSDLTKAKNLIKEDISLEIVVQRTGYPYFSEPEFNGKSLQNRFKNKEENRIQARTIQGYLYSDDLELYYRCLPMKSYCTQLVQRHNIPKYELVQTSWFKAKLEKIIGV